MSSNQQLESFALRVSSQEGRSHFYSFVCSGFKVEPISVGPKALKSANPEVKVEPISVGLKALKSANREVMVEPISVGLKASKSANQEEKVEPISVPLR